MGITPKRLAAFESGEREPSLVELEVLAYYLDVPLQALVNDSVRLPEPRTVADLRSLSQLRARIIGARLRQARMEKGESVKDAAAAAGLKPAELNAYELGRRPAPITKVEKLLEHYGLHVEELLDLGIGQIGQAQLMAKQRDEFDGLPEDVKAFVGRPAALPYLQLAMHLSKLPHDQLRAAAEVLAAATAAQDAERE